MSTTLQSLLLRWLPISVIVVTEMALLVPLRERVIAGTTWGPFVSLLALGVSMVLLIDLSDLTDIRSRIPNPNGATILGYLWQLVFFAFAIAPIIFVPMRR